MTDEPIVIAHNNTTVAEGGNSEPLPENTKVLATILATNKDGTAIVKRPLSKDAPNNVITALAVRFRVEGPVGIGRNLFVDVPLARNLKSTGGGKYPDGTPAFFFFQFFRALGLDVDDPAGFTVPGDREIMGKQVELVLGIEEANGEYEARNRVKFINKANGVPAKTAAPARVSEPASAGAVQEGWKPPSEPAVQQQPAAAAGWTPDPMDVAHAAAVAATPVPDDASSLEGQKTF